MSHHLASVVTVCLAAAACGSRGERDPEAVVEHFIAAANAGNSADVYALLGPNSRKRLDELRQSAKRVSGRLALQPEDFLSVGRAPPAWEPQGVRLLHKSNVDATVQVYSAAGDRYAVNLVRQGHAWKVELPGS
ncbi:MAG: hypothetical protein SF187_12690 [Deltaproteobacteria bacterium]|nr:hypothetical protein [Deltaproteobacteria bacterium]